MILIKFYSQMTDLQRVKKVIKWLIFSDFGENEKDIAGVLEYEKSYLSQVMNGKVPISEKFIDKLLSLDKNINKVWVLTGRGEMFNSKTFESVETKSNDKYIALLEENIKTLKAQIKDKEEKEVLYKEKIRSLEEKSMNEKNSAVYSTARGSQLKL